MFNFLIQRVLVSLFLAVTVFFSASAMKFTDGSIPKSERAINDYELFKIVQKIGSLLKRTNIELKDSGTCTKGSKKRRVYKLNPFFHQTKSGLFIVELNDLWTPWGTVNLGLGKGKSFWELLALQQAFLKKLKTSYFGATGDDFCRNKRAKFYELKSNGTDLRKMCAKKYKNGSDGELQSDLDSLFQELSWKELEGKSGEDTFLYSNCEVHKLIYKIHKVGDCKLPEPQLLDFERCKESCVVDEAWKKMKKKFLDEKRAKKGLVKNSKV